MAYDDQGRWKPEDDSVQTQVDTLLKPDNPFVQEAQGMATRAANRRGLINSTLATEAGTKAAIDAVTPIAAQTASQISAKNLSGQGAVQSLGLQTSQQAADAARQAADLKAAQDRLNTQLASSEKVSANQLAAADRQQTTQIKANTATQGTDLTAAQTRLETQNSSTSAIAALDANVRTQLDQLDRATQEKIAGMNVSADQKKSVISQAIAISSNYASEFNSINSNPNIPADVRAQLLTSIATQRDQDLSFIEQTSGIDLNWSSIAAPPPVAAATAAAPAPAAPTASASVAPVAAATAPVAAPAASAPASAAPATRTPEETYSAPPGGTPTYESSGNTQEDADVINATINGAPVQYNGQSYTYRVDQGIWYDQGGTRVPTGSATWWGLNGQTGV